jgi:hypothetical protein
VELEDHQMKEEAKNRLNEKIKSKNKRNKYTTKDNHQKDGLGNIQELEDHHQMKEEAKGKTNTVNNQQEINKKIITSKKFKKKKNNNK